MHVHHQSEQADVQEFGEVYARYRSRLVGYCGRRLRDPADAEDAAHEALFRAFQAWDRFDHTADPWPWLATIAARVCVDVRRRASRLGAGDAVPAAVDVHDLAVARLRASILDDALGELPTRYRNALILREYAGWSYRDIAELEGTTVASVRSNIMRSRRSLGARVESVARAKGQWPLPAVVPGVADRVKERARSWREVMSRLLDSAVVFTGLALIAPAAGAAVAAPAVAALAVVAADVPAAAQQQAPVTEGRPAADTASPASSSAPVRALLPAAPRAAAAHVRSHVTQAARETLTGVHTPQPALRAGVGVGALVAVDAGPDALFVNAELRWRTPVGSNRVWTDPNVPCRTGARKLQRWACDKGSDALRRLPER
jgi:RNA polymerase sigma factor (sigma-70 family)